MATFQKFTSGEDGCSRCTDGGKPIDFEFAFQPIVSFSSHRVVGHEALARGPCGEPASSVLRQLTASNVFRFDQDCRIRAIESASALGMQGMLSINFIPNAVADPRACIRRTLDTASKCRFPLENIILELTEREPVEDPSSLVAIFREYRQLGIRTAIDDFGAGYAGLNLLARFQPDFIKIDIGLVRDIDRISAKQSIVSGIVNICRDLNVAVLAEGVESVAERDYLRSLGIDLMQGFLFARPTFKALAEVDPAAI